MSIAAILRSILRRWRILLAATALGLLASILLTVFSPVKWEASAQLFVSTSASSSTQDLAQGNTFAQARVQSYVDAATSPAVTDFVQTELNLPFSSNELASMISADAPLNKVLINIHVVDTSRERSARIANAVADRFKSVVESLESSGASQTSPVKLSVLRPATVPSSPESPRPEINIPLGLIIGIALGGALALIRDRSDVSYKNGEMLAASLHVPLLGVIPLDRQADVTPLSMRGDTHGLRSEAFRVLRTNLQFVKPDNPPRVIAVTSALPGEGKSLTAANLAVSLAEVGARVCLIEADLRRPTLGKIFGVIETVGVTSVLVGKVSIEDALQNAGANLAILCAGAPAPNPTELLASEHWRDLVKYVANEVDYVILDTAPLLPVADGVEVASSSDASMLVVRAGKTSEDQANRAVESLSKVGAFPVGCVLSMSRGAVDSSYYYYREAAGEDK